MPIQDLTNQKLCVWCSAITSLPCDSDACWSLRSTDLWKLVLSWGCKTLLWGFFFLGFLKLLRKQGKTNLGTKNLTLLVFSLQFNPSYSPLVHLLFDTSFVDSSFPAIFSLHWVPKALLVSICWPSVECLSSTVMRCIDKLTSLLKEEIVCIQLHMELKLQHTLV